MLLGLDNAGKTTIMTRLSSNEIQNIKPTVGFNVKTTKINGFMVNLWDIGGQKTIRTYWRTYFQGTDLLIFVVDSTDKTRLSESGHELALLLQEVKLLKVPLLVYANKQDVITSLQAHEIAVGLNLNSIRDRNWQIQGCSAKTGEGISTGMEWALSLLKK